MKVIYCSSPINNKKVDYDYQNELYASKKTGFEFELIDFDDLLNRDFDKALKNIKISTNFENGIFRGWMLKPELYELFYSELEKRKIRLINTPQEYLNCHYFPYSYETIKNKTPKSTWLEINGEINFDIVMEKLNIFDGKPIILKDYVKSQKHKWKEACFINNSNNSEEVKKVVNKFIELQGLELNKGLVFREYCELEFIGEHSKSKMPLTKEYRMFFMNNSLIHSYNYWDEGDYKTELPIIEDFLELAKNIDSNFFTIDIAKTIDNKWIIIEVGDGQVSGLPDNANLESFYNRIKEILKVD